MLPNELKQLIEKYCQGLTPTTDQENEINEMVYKLGADPLEVFDYIETVKKMKSKAELETEERIRKEKERERIKDERIDTKMFSIVIFLHLGLSVFFIIKDYPVWMLLSIAVYLFLYQVSDSGKILRLLVPVISNGAFFIYRAIDYGRPFWMWFWIAVSAILLLIILGRYINDM